MILPISVTVSVETPARPPLWMIKEDVDLFGSVRPCAPCPAVVVLKDDPHAAIDEQWQYYLRAINYAMDLEDVYLLLDYRLAFANGTGFRKDGSPKADYFHRRDLDAKMPSLDKVRTCSRNCITGAESYSLAQAIRTAVADWSLSGLTTNNVLKVTTFDSRMPPPLKPGKSYPGRVEDVHPDDYLYLPQTHPWMFAVANIVNKAGEVVQFPRGGLYAWTGDHTPYSFLPLISNHSYGDVLVPLSTLMPIAPNAPIPSVYRSN